MAKVFPIKLCGITRLEDAQLAVDLGVQALGFVFYEKSPRYISPEKVAEICGRLVCARPVLTVGVFVNAPETDLRRYQALSGIDILQLHGEESVEEVQRVQDLRLWKAFRLRDGETFPAVNGYAGVVEAFLFDAFSVKGHGGTGERISDSLREKIPREKPFLLAGGFGPENWRDAYERFHPLAIDLSSSVESAPGVKDAERLKQLFHDKI